MLQDDDPQVRAAAVLGLASLGDDAALHAVESLHADPDPWVRNAVAQARRRLGWG